MSFYEDQYSRLIEADTFKYMESLPDHSFDLIVADPPYFLSNDGFSNSGGKMVSVNKGAWDESANFDPETFYTRFIEDASRLLNDNGTMWVFGTMHNIYQLGYLLQKSGFKILNNVTWQKSNPAPNLSCRMFTHSTETILWVKKATGKQLFNYSLMREQNGYKQMKDVWTTPTVNKSEKRFGKHPTQKPLSVMLRILESSSNGKSHILDPFIGSGTTAVAGKLLNRHVTGVDNNSEFLEIAKQRLINFSTERIGNIK